MENPCSVDSNHDNNLDPRNSTSISPYLWGNPDIVYREKWFTLIDKSLIRLDEIAQNDRDQESLLCYINKAAKCLVSYEFKQDDIYDGLKTAYYLQKENNSDLLRLDMRYLAVVFLAEVRASMPGRDKFSILFDFDDEFNTIILKCIQSLEQELWNKDISDELRCHNERLTLLLNHQPTINSYTDDKIGDCFDEINRISYVVNTSIRENLNTLMRCLTNSINYVGNPNKLLKFYQEKRKAELELDELSRPVINDVILHGIWVNTIKTCHDEFMNLAREVAKYGGVKIPKTLHHVSNYYSKLSEIDVKEYEHFKDCPGAAKLFYPIMSKQKRFGLIEVYKLLSNLNDIERFEIINKLYNRSEYTFDAYTFKDILFPLLMDAIENHPYTSIVYPLHKVLKDELGKLIKKNIVSYHNEFYKFLMRKAQKDELFAKQRLIFNLISDGLFVINNPNSTIFNISRSELYHMLQLDGYEIFINKNIIQQCENGFIYNEDEYIKQRKQFEDETTEVGKTFSSFKKQFAEIAIKLNYTWFKDYQF